MFVLSCGVVRPVLERSARYINPGVRFMLRLSKLPKNGGINTLCSVMSPVGSPIPRPGGQFQVLELVWRVESGGYIGHKCKRGE